MYANKYALYYLKVVCYYICSYHVYVTVWLYSEFYDIPFSTYHVATSLHSYFYDAMIMKLSRAGRVKGQVLCSAGVSCHC